MGRCARGAWLEWRWWEVGGGVAGYLGGALGAELDQCRDTDAFVVKEETGDEFQALQYAVGSDKLS